MKKRNGAIIGMLALISVFTLVSCASTEFADDPLDLVGSLDLQRYLGRWYEVARFQHPFEKTLVGATAEYSLREDGRVTVLNSGFKKSLDGTYTSVQAVAWRPDEKPARSIESQVFRSVYFRLPGVRTR